MRRKVLAFLLVACVSAVAAPVAVSAASTPAKDPVILVAGMGGPAFAYEPLAARLRSDGYQVWIYQIPTLGFDDIRVTSAPLGALVDSVRAQTGSAKVDLVGHSEGGLVSRYYIKNLGGASKVDSLVTLGTPNYGTYVANIISFFALGNCLGIPACEQMTTGSSFLASLNSGADVPSGVSPTAIYTADDELVRPVTNARMDVGTNVRIQDKCWLRFVGHAGLILDGTTYSGVKQALAKQTINLNCWAV